MISIMNGAEGGCSMLWKKHIPLCPQDSNEPIGIQNEDSVYLNSMAIHSENHLSFQCGGNFEK